jgi:hypothetical protein
MITMLAVKFDSTNDHKKFTPFDIEIAKYWTLKLSIERECFACAAEVNFMLLPTEDNGRQLCFIHLDEFDAGIAPGSSDAETRRSLFSLDHRRCAEPTELPRPASSSRHVAACMMNSALSIRRGCRTRGYDGPSALISLTPVTCESPIRRNEPLQHMRNHLCDLDVAAGLGPAMLRHKLPGDPQDQATRSA